MSNLEFVAPALAQALAARGYSELTPVQDAVLEPDYAAADLIVSAQTGSGKTVAFGMALAPTLLQGEDRFGPAEKPLALVIAPTRELAMQVKAELQWLYAPAGAVLASCVGGMDGAEERRALYRGAHIVVGTPGRLMDHIRRGALAMSQLRAVVLDEADEMLNLGFREELEAILEASPAERRTLMFSATMPRAIEQLAAKYQRDAIRVNTVSESKQHLDIDYRAMVVASHESENAIFNVLRYYDAPNALVFCSTRAAVTRLMTRFNNRGFNVVALSGELSQAQRTHALQALRDHRAQVCVATDVAARGIDLPDLELVIHAELPKNTEGLLHRSGRTGRAGKRGTSVLIVPHKYRKSAERLLRNADIDAEWGAPPSAADIRKRDDERLLADPILYEPANGGEREFAQTLLAAYDADQVAAAFVRLYRKGKAAPEDLAAPPAWDEAPAREKPGKRERAERPERAPRAERAPREGPRTPPRDNFRNGSWVRLSVGREQNAEPRWIIPIICNAGGVVKRSIGAIRIEQDHTLVEIDPAVAEDFIDNISRAGKLDRNIEVTPAEAPPPSAEVYVASGPETPKGTKPVPRAERAERVERPERPERAPRPPRAEAQPEPAPYQKPQFEKRPREKPKHKKQRDEAKGGYVTRPKPSWHPDGPEAAAAARTDKPPRSERKPRHKPRDNRHAPGAPARDGGGPAGGPKPFKKKKWRPDA